MTTKKINVALLSDAEIDELMHRLSTAKKQNKSNLQNIRPATIKKLKRTLIELVNGVGASIKLTATVDIELQAVASYSAGSKSPKIITYPIRLNRLRVRSKNTTMLRLFDYINDCLYDMDHDEVGMHVDYMDPKLLDAKITKKIKKKVKDFEDRLKKLESQHNLKPGSLLTELCDETGI